MSNLNTSPPSQTSAVSTTSTQESSANTSVTVQPSPPSGTTNAEEVERLHTHWVDMIRLETYTKPYIDKATEKELLREAINHGLTINDARHQLLQICQTSKYALESYLEEKATRILERCIEQKNEIDSECFTDAVAAAKQAAYGYLKEEECRQKVKKLITINQWPERQGFPKNAILALGFSTLILIILFLVSRSW
ncbi:hypothetical protein TI05_03975 [Achromatium sp. WMS3]|nr:hypothetical protein TI05_03975 [Achromatium sp. WMS3]